MIARCKKKNPREVRLEFLYWGNPSTAYYGSAASSKLNDEKVREIRQLRAEGVPAAECAKMFKVTPMTINRIDRYESWG